MRRIIHGIHEAQPPGPLIRIVGDKFPGSVKKAIVEALRSLLVRGGTWM